MAITGRPTIYGTRGVDNFGGKSSEDIYAMTVDWGVTDVVDGGSGTDTLSYQLADRGVTVVMGFNTKSGYVSGYATAEFRSQHFVNPVAGQVFDTFKSYTVTQFKNIEDVTGSGYNDKITGNSDGNRIDGLAGKDEIHGGGGSDVIIGGRGGDSLFGDTGADRFVFNSFLDSALTSVLTSQVTPNTPFDPGLGIDAIRDFEVGRDKIDLSAIDADSTRQNDQKFKFLESPNGVDPATFSGTAGELILMDIAVAPSPDTPSGFFTAVLGDIDGDAQWDFQIRVIVTEMVPLSANDFLL